MRGERRRARGSIGCVVGNLDGKGIAEGPMVQGRDHIEVMRDSNRVVGDWGCPT